MIPHDRHYRKSLWDAVTKLAASMACEWGEGGAKQAQQLTTRMVNEDEGWDYMVTKYKISKHNLYGEVQITLLIWDLIG